MRCPICNKVPKGMNHFELHHRVKRSAGGDNNPLNLIQLCSECHKLAHDQPQKFRKLYGDEQFINLMPKSKNKIEYRRKLKELEQ